GSVRQLIARVVNTIVNWGEAGRYFASTAARDAFRDDLTHLLVQQKMSFNSPVWFNVGVQPKPQCSACFINSVQDDMKSIMDLVKTEGMLFKWGSGTGTNFSALRGSHESLSGGGIASGPVSFMKGFDARSEEHTSELQSPYDIVCRLLLEKKKTDLGSVLLGLR